MASIDRSALFTAAAHGDLATVRSFFCQSHVQTLVGETNELLRTTYAAALASGRNPFSASINDMREPWYCRPRPRWTPNDNVELLVEEPVKRRHVYIVDWFFDEEASALVGETIRHLLRPIFKCVRFAPAYGPELAEIILSSSLYRAMSSLEQDFVLSMMLDVAVEANSVDCVRLVVALGVSLANPTNALETSCQHDDDTMTQLLLDCGVSPEKLESNYLIEAAVHGNMELVQLILAQGFADVNARDFHGRTPLMSVFHEWNVYSREDGIRRSYVVSYLLENGADVHLRSSVADSVGVPLPESFFEDEIQEVLRTLLTYGADPNAQDQEWLQTPLQYLADCFEHGPSWTPFGILLSHGADPHLPDADGDTPLSILMATSQGHEHVDKHEGYFRRWSS
ncbi:hypothetical protein Poli38472_009354 [Pythium oligandrum]|uniref:Ankyrin n=1 Tax=Pythium oligandrum TaxID=41045 RepID=A0A8K1CMP8_PYTOL|nr:hypothetical protein Poli38472_009354 [Pythium oligandrum]|eukprot:TMW65187.1 hypothetical protein Poli38472_009354 [Pythium oligandrum]